MCFKKMFWCYYLSLRLMGQIFYSENHIRVKQAMMLAVARVSGPRLSQEVSYPQSQIK